MRKKNLARKEELENEMRDKHRVFARAYVSEGWNKTKAYKKAYPDCKTDNSAAVSAINLLRNPKIKEYIDLIRHDYEDLCGINKTWLINKWRNLAEANITDVLDFDDEGNTWIKSGLSLSDLPRNVTALISEVKPSKDGIQVKILSPETALMHLAKLLGYNAADKTDITTAGKPIEPARVEFINAKNYDADL